MTNKRFINQLGHFQVVDARNVEKLLGSVHKYDTAGKAAIARVRVS